MEQVICLEPLSGRIAVWACFAGGDADVRPFCQPIDFPYLAAGTDPRFGVDFEEELPGLMRELRLL